MSEPSDGAANTPSNISPLPNERLDWAYDDPKHPGFVIHGVDDTPGRKAYFIHLEAKEGKEELVQRFLHDINDGVDQEPMTGPWFSLRFSKTTFCIFEAFPNVEGRNDHNKGPGGRNFLRADLLKDMLAYPAQIYRMDVEHGKFGVILGQKISPVLSKI
jgi:hypothetical protein